MFRIGRKAAIILCVFAAIAVITFGLTLPRAEATEDVIIAELERLNAGECSYLGETTIADGKELYRHYQNKKKQMDYYFEADSGLLHSITCFDAVDAQEKGAPLSDEERDAAVLDFAQHCIAAYQIGELRITSSHFNNVRTYNYTLTEYYKGEETGTVITMAVTDNAEIVFCIFTRGEIFNSEPINTIGETAAIEAAKVLVDELSAEHRFVLTGNVNCALKANGATRFYLVEFSAVSVENDQYPRTYIIHVDASSGTIIQEAWTQ